MRWLLLLVAAPFLLNAPVIAMLSDPWAPWRFSGHAGAIIAGAPPAVAIVAPEPGDLARGHIAVSDAQRYRLALAAGFSPADALIAVAISIAENGSGDPATLSPINRNGSRDLGLWQVNSVHWAEFGGPDILAIPSANAHAALVLYRRGGWTQWCTYPGGCGGGPGSPFWSQALARARVAAIVPLPAGQA